MAKERYFFDDKRVKQREVWDLLYTNKSTVDIISKAKKQRVTGYILGGIGALPLAKGLVGLYREHILNTIFNNPQNFSRQTNTQLITGGIITLAGFVQLLRSHGLFKRAINIYNNERSKISANVKFGVSNNGSIGWFVQF